jgi:hypothetical protein
MLKTRVGKVTTLAVVLLVAVVAVMTGAKVHFPYRHPRESLNRYLERDFGAALPGSTTVAESYWVGYRNAEAAFKMQMTPEDAVQFVEKLRTAAHTHERWITSSPDVRVSHPIYDPPKWWNEPPLDDGQTLDIIVTGEGGATCHYLLLYSAATGKVYLVWGGFTGAP